MKYIYFHNWYYSEGSEELANSSMETIQNNIYSFPYKDDYYEIAVAETLKGDHYWLLLFLISTEDSLSIREKLDKWTDDIGVKHNDDRSIINVQDSIEECINTKYAGDYRIHSIIKNMKD